MIGIASMICKDEDPQNDPGVISVRNIYDYYKKHRYQTVIMGASFRKASQIIALAGCDRLTIAPALLEELNKIEGDLGATLTPSTTVETPPLAMTEAEFYWQHNQDPMAVDKLAEGIRLFAKDQEKLEAMLSELLEKKGAANAVA
jgi:transaldolase